MAVHLQLLVTTYCPPTRLWVDAAGPGANGNTGGTNGADMTIGEHRMDDGVFMSEEENKKLVAAIHSARFVETAVLRNFSARLGMLRPITGYAALMYSNAPFDMDMIDANVFHGVAACTLNMRCNRALLDRLEHGVNALVPDKSPAPLSRARRHNWVCSLGPDGFLAVCEYSSTREKQHLLIVASAGLDDASYEEMFAEMRKLHRTATVQQACDKLEFWRQGAATNRSRLLAMVRRMLEEPSIEQKNEAFDRVSVANDTPAAAYPESAYDNALKWLGVKYVPTWYCLPDRTPRGCAPIPPGLEGFPLGAHVPPDRADPYPRSVADVTFDVCTDDVCFYRDSFHIRLAGCCYGEHEWAVQMTSPMKPIVLFRRTNKDFCFDRAQTFGAIPVRTQPEYKNFMPKYDDSLRCTWEDAAQSNRVLESNFPDHAPETTQGYGDSETWYPVFVRVAMKNDVGLVLCTPKDRDPRSRTAGFASDPYVYVSRRPGPLPAAAVRT